ncbi:hypothetical protein M9H77_08575 [Catharanthus roseus]|uniref:Uncharacterized protein n=1 Tax=Catharanthus roseus TaxID=4058 RepID=A0ACC0BYB7_CATRO|nr:hypothetical protein M9H77_08575 [Catharanthus roseus]
MVRPGACRGDDDLGAVTDRTDQVEGRAVTASSRGVRGRHSTLDISSTSAPTAPGIPPIPFTTHPPTTSYHPYTPVPYDPYGYSQPPQTSYDPYAHDPSLPIRMPGLDPTQYFSRTQIPLNDDRDILKSRSRYVSLIGWTPSDPAVSDLDISGSSIGINAQDSAGVADSPRCGLSTDQRAACYVLYLLGSSLFTDKSGNNVPGKLWPLVKNIGFAWIYLYFPMFAPSVRAGARLCKPYIQRFAMFGHKTKNKLID